MRDTVRMQIRTWRACVLAVRAETKEVLRGQLSMDGTKLAVRGIETIS